MWHVKYKGQTIKANMTNRVDAELFIVELGLPATIYYTDHFIY